MNPILVDKALEVLASLVDRAGSALRIKLAERQRQRAEADLAALRELDAQLRGPGGS